ncbi:hypothetical protein CKAH01_11557 [Colletotrichum kahawae]|uniref:Uncharacterized protein n=1 Tax=Colletotrichum kahawae TaxID=34407 RepID=A0AAD9YTJ7_COLKA|nr:hypothetical protein CKAH01_11557 [Colletotrichum kahawae]
MPKIVGTSMMEIQEIEEDASDFKLPQSSAALFVEFHHTNGHRSREHQPPLSNIANPDRCQRHQVAAYEKLYSKKRPRTEDESPLSFDDRHKRLRHLLHHLPSNCKPNQEDSNKTTEAEHCGKGKSIKVNGKSSIEAKGESIKGTLTDLLKIGTTQQQEAVKESIAQVAGAVATTTFVHTVL